MKGAEITDAVLAAIAANKYKFIRLNFPNGDMVGHTGVYQATQIAVETVDLCLSRLIPAVQAAGGIIVISADHGNADDMYEHEKKTGKAKVENGKLKVKTAHSLNPVPVFIYDPSGTAKLKLGKHTGLGISSLAATCLRLLGFEPPANYDPSVVEVG
jgi:2,3-bisphosphoglycerate-independent phosphoglycerate mutase